MLRKTCLDLKQDTIAEANKVVAGKAASFDEEEQADEGQQVNEEEQEGEEHRKGQKRREKGKKNPAPAPPPPEPLSSRELSSSATASKAWPPVPVRPVGGKKNQRPPNQANVGASLASRKTIGNIRIVRGKSNRSEAAVARVKSLPPSSPPSSTTSESDSDDNRSQFQMDVDEGPSDSAGGTRGILNPGPHATKKRSRRSSASPTPKNFPPQKKESSNRNRDIITRGPPDLSARHQPNCQDRIYYTARSQ